MIDKIIGIIFLPLSILLFLNIFEITAIDSVFGVSILLIAAISLIIIQVANVLGAHHAKEHVNKSYLLCTIAAFPSIIYFISSGVQFSDNVIISFPAMFASFIFVEGIYGFYF